MMRVKAWCVSLVHIYISALAKMCVSIKKKRLFMVHTRCTPDQSTQHITRQSLDLGHGTSECVWYKEKKKRKDKLHDSKAK